MSEHDTIGADTYPKQRGARMTFQLFDAEGLVCRVCAEQLYRAMYFFLSVAGKFPEVMSKLVSDMKIAHSAT
jgi:hypothetical protein